jgi:hypothetical protein
MSNVPAISVTDAMASPLLFGPFFRGPSWDMWRAVLKAAAAEPMSESEKAAFGAVAAREPPARPVKELICVAGRGAGKDSIASLIATCAAINFDPRGKLRPGEKATVMCLACDRHQAAILFRYIAGYFEAIPALKAMVTAIGGDYIELCNDVAIEVHTNSFRAVRGRSILCAVLDEVAFFRDENFASPDTEFDAALSPGLARVPGSIKVLISSVHKRSGLLYQRYRDFYGKDMTACLSCMAPPCSSIRHLINLSLRRPSPKIRSGMARNISRNGAMISRHGSRASYWMRRSIVGFSSGRLPGI